jgi:hypothetical protein
MVLGSEIRDPEKIYSGSRIQGSKRHRIRIRNTVTDAASAITRHRRSVRNHRSQPQLPQSQVADAASAITRHRRRRLQSHVTDAASAVTRHRRGVRNHASQTQRPQSHAQTLRPQSHVIEIYYPTPNRVRDLSYETEFRIRAILRRIRIL